MSRSRSLSRDLQSSLTREARWQEEFEHGAVAQAGRPGCVDGLDDLLDLFQIQELGDGLPLPGRAQVLGRVLR